MIVTVYHCRILGSTPDAGTGMHNVNNYIFITTASKQTIILYIKQQHEQCCASCKMMYVMVTVIILQLYTTTGVYHLWIHSY